MKRIVIASALAALVLSSCSLIQGDSDEVTSPTSSTAPASPEVDLSDQAIVTGIPTDPFASAVYDQDIQWRDCGELQCATVQVPLDWSDPTGPTISLAINRRLADNQADRVGSLLLNPGGPGGSGIELLEYFEPTAGEKLLEHFDLVGFDPRGVGESSPVNCGNGALLDSYYVSDFVVEDESDLATAAEMNKELAASCRGLTGALVANVDTVSVARDMDVLRAILGDEKLYYLGFSYGTQLGATYAEIYPQNVGRLVLDGAVDILLDSEEQSLRQAEGFERALSNFIDWCLGRPDSCPLEGPADNARKQIAKLALDARTTPYPSDGNVQVNGNLMIYGIVVTLYDEASWEYLELALTETLERDTARMFYELANFYLDRDGQSGDYLSNSTPVFTAINCLDAVQEPGDIKQQKDFAAAIDEVAPTFGWWFSGSAGCVGWPFSADQRVESLDNAKTAAPMVVIGTTNDPATPYQWAVSLAEDLGATLVTYDGEGHTAYGRSNQCIIDAVDAYLVDGVIPAQGTAC